MTRIVSLFLLLSINFLLIFGAVKENYLRVQLSTGWIEGIRKTASYSPFGNQTANCFLGIPYAKPPTGELRFRKAQRVLPWDGILEAKEYKPACLSDPVRTYKTSNGGSISEDCLYLNVFTNDYCQLQKNCSVFVVIHGGQFQFESGSAFDPHILINNFVGQDRNIVVVTINYRLGVFGFNHLFGDENDNELNLGIRDTIDSLKWVQREIRALGGDPLKVTLGGHSAGAILTALIRFSPMSRGLFQQMIVMSPSHLGYTKYGNSLFTREVARRLGCMHSEYSMDQKIPSEDCTKIYTCLREADADKILKAQLEIEYNSTIFFGMSFVDGEVIPDYVFEIGDDHQINNPINLLIGTVTAEQRETIYLQDLEGNADHPRLYDLCKFTAMTRRFENVEKFVEMCVQEYSKNDQAQYLTDDYQFYSAVLRIANAQLVQGSNVYLYSYNYTGAQSAFNNYITGSPAPSHSEDLIYVLGTHRGQMLEKDYTIEKIYSGMFADFINLRTKLPRYSKENREYYLIDFDEKFNQPGARDHAHERAHKFWNERVPRETGGIVHTSKITDFVDTFYITAYVDVIRSHIYQTKRSDKSIEVCDKIYRQLMSIGEIPWRAELQKSSGISWFLMISSIFLLAIVLVFVAVKLCCRRRNDYQMLN